MRFPFRLKLALLASTFASVPLLVVGWLVIDVNERELESTTEQLAIALAEEIAGDIDARAAGTERALGAIGAALTDASLDEPTRLALALRLLDATPELDVVAIYGADGALIDRMRSEEAAAVETPDVLDAALGAEARAHGAAVASATRDASGVRVLLVVPLSVRGTATGFAAAPVSLAPIDEEIARLASVQLAGDEGALVVIDERSRAVMGGPEAETLAVIADAPPAPGARSESGEHVDAAGRAWLRTVARVERWPWRVVADVPRDVALASLRETRTIVAVAIATALVLAFAASWLLAQRMAAPIATLVAFTRDLAARRFDRRPTVRTGDEMDVLAKALGDAAEELDRSEKRAREEAAIRSDLGRYLPAEIVEKIVRREQSMELGGQRVPITVLFADVVAFTPLSERLPPEQVVSLLNELFTLLTEAVFRHGGTVDKLIGDCVMALWGAPSAHADHARRAVLAAQDMARFCESANAGWKERYGVEVRLAIGIHTGEAVVGNVGSRERMEYTAIGDVVNVAARLETIARPQQILVSRATADAIAGDFEVTPLGARELAGRKEPVELCEVAW
ncbi:MAG: adenylate/guanylate cyclase domain-containing protein [Sandaracinus sp.]